MAISVVSACDNDEIHDNNTLSESANSYLEVNNETQDSLEADNSNDNISIDQKADSQIKTDSNSLKSGTVKKLTAKNIVSTYGKTVTFSVKLTDSSGNVVKNKEVIFKLAGKTYKVTSNSKGLASIKVKLNAGKYKVKYSCDNISGSNTIKFKNAYKIKVYKWKSGANVKKNKKIKSHIPKSALAKKMVKLAKKGTPMIKFKGGKGKKVFITAGVHGNELSSQIAALKLIKYLKSHPIKGTVYIMPFINPKGTASNVRDYNGVHLNKKANTKGTISYKTVRLIVKFKCDAYGDFHCTKPGGTPGKNVAMGTYKPTAKSAVMAKFIAKNSNVKYLIYKKAGVEYPGAMEDEVNLKHIPAVTCEVITPQGKIAKGSIGRSLSMMKSLLKFNGLI